MKRFGSRRWILAVGALMVVVSLGAVACESTSNDAGAVGDQRARDRVQGPAADQGIKAPGAQAPLAECRENMQDRREGSADRRAALLDDLREKMSAEDQALFDELRAAIEEQREALEKNRQELSESLKQLRELADKYLDLDLDQERSEQQ